MCKTFRPSLYIVLFLAALLMQAGCSTAQVENEKKWMFMVATPKHYDVWVNQLEFEKPGFRHWRHPAGYLQCCWKGPNGPRGVAGRMMPFPEYIGIEWFSFSEQKFYQRVFSLPENLREAMSKPAAYSTNSGTFEAPRNMLTIGLAPGGTIVLWIMNQIGNEIEVARFQANEIEGDPSEYEAGTQRYLDEHGPYLEKHGVPTEGW